MPFMRLIAAVDVEDVGSSFAKSASQVMIVDLNSCLLLEASTKSFTDLCVRQATQANLWRLSVTVLMMSDDKCDKAEDWAMRWLAAVPVAWR